MDVGAMSPIAVPFSHRLPPPPRPATTVPAAANAEACAQPHWRVIAAGFDTERWFNDDQAVGTHRIVNPQPTRLAAGQYYCRFASRTSARATQLGGGWWVEFENFAHIRRFAQDKRYHLRDAARLMLALPCAWAKASPVPLRRRSRSRASIDGVGGIHRLRIPAGSDPGSGGDRIVRP